MTNPINQIQASYNPIEDRLLLNIKTFNEQVYVAWITRRFLKLLLPALHGKHPITGATLFDDATPGLHQEKPQESAIKGNFNNDYKLANTQDYPLGEVPILLTKITFKALNTEQAELCLESESNQSIQLPFNPELLSALLSILERAIKAIDWNLELNPLLEMPSQRRLH